MPTPSGVRALPWHARLATAHACGLVRRGACGSSAGWRAAYIADVERLRSRPVRPGFEHHPLESGAGVEGELRCTAHTQTPSQGGRGVAQGWRGPTRWATDATAGMCGVQRASSGVPTDELAEGAARLPHMDAGACVSMQACTCRMYYVRTLCTVDSCAQNREACKGSAHCFV